MTPKILLLSGPFNSKVSKLIGALLQMSEKLKETKGMGQIGSSSGHRSRDLIHFKQEVQESVQPFSFMYLFS